LQRPGEARIGKSGTLLTFKKDDEGGWSRARVATPERLLRLGWREIRSYRYEDWVVTGGRVRTLPIREIIFILNNLSQVKIWGNGWRDRI